MTPQRRVFGLTFELSPDPGGQAELDRRAKANLYRYTPWAEIQRHGLPITRAQLAAMGDDAAMLALDDMQRRGASAICVQYRGALIVGLAK